MDNNTSFKRLYLAGPLFSESELDFNKSLKRKLKPYFKIYLPQEDGGHMLTLIKNGMDPKKVSKDVFNKDIKAINKCDYLLIILNGKLIDEGAAFELGIAYNLEKICIGLQTDLRYLYPNYMNPMISNSLSRIFSSIDELVKWAESI